MRALIGCGILGLSLLSGETRVLAQRADTLVKMATAPKYAGVATLREEASIGVLEGEDEYMFGSVQELVAGPDGSFYVYDSQVPALRKYDANGKFVRLLGRKGQGPGEYMNAGGLAVAPDGRVLLWDTGLWRINVYSPAGDFITSFATPSGISGTYSTQKALLVDTAGVIHFRRTFFDRGQPGQRRSSRTVWIRLRGNGTVIDTLEIPKVSADPPLLTATSGSSSMTTAVPFAPQPLATLSPFGYFVTAFPQRYAFELPQRGRTNAVVSVRRNVQPERVTAAERSEQRNSVEERLRRTDPGWRWNGPDIPATKPSFTAIAVGADGRIWIPLIPESARGGGVSMSVGGGGTAPRTQQTPQQQNDRTPSKPALYDVFEPDGSYLGQVQVPARVTSFYRRGDHVWAVALGEEDVATVKRYRILWR